MKLRILLSLLFLIGITLASAHELEHINGEHEHPSCEICSINDSLHGLDSTKTDLLYPLIAEKKITPEILLYSLHPKAKTNYPNAPNTASFTL